MNGTSRVPQAPANPEPQGFTQVTIDTIRQIRHLSTGAALLLLYKLRTDRTETGAWTSTIADDADMIGASPSSVKAGRKRLAALGCIELWPTVSSGGDNGPDIIVVVENVPEGKSTEDAAREHAVTRRMRLRRDARPKVTVRQDSVPLRSAVRQDSVPLRTDEAEGVETGFGPTARGETGTCPTSTQTTLDQTTSVTGSTTCSGAAAASAGWDEPWMEVIARCIEFAGGHNQTRQALIAHARVFTWIAENYSADEAGRALISATQMIRSGTCGTAAALKAATERLFPTPMAYTDTRRSRTEASLWCPYRFEARDGKFFLVPKDHPPLENSPEPERDDLEAEHGYDWDDDAPPHEDRDYTPTDDDSTNLVEVVEPDVTVIDAGDTYSVMATSTPAQRAASDARVRREFGLPPLDEPTPQPVEPAADPRPAELVTAPEPAIETPLAELVARLRVLESRRLNAPFLTEMAELRAEIARRAPERPAALVRTDDAPDDGTTVSDAQEHESRHPATGDGAIPTIHHTKEAQTR